jgi:hypothetical protein
MWLIDEGLLAEWNKGKAGGEGGLEDSAAEAEVRWAREDAQQRVVPICARHYGGLCDGMMHTSGTVSEALCRCGYGDHRRVKDYAAAILQMGGYFGYFCSCWGILDYDHEVEDRGGQEPDLDHESGRPSRVADSLPEGASEYDVAVESLPYGFGRDADDLMALAHDPNFPHVHRPWLADTNGWVPYASQDIGAEGCHAVIGSYWQNADCWAKSNRGLSGLPGWPGSIAAFLGLFQCHLYQNALGAWDQGYPAGLLRQIADMTRLAREGAVDAPELRLARVMVLKTVPWLRHNQEDDGLWDHSKLPCHLGYDEFPCISRRLGSYHIVSALDDFGVLDRLCRTG